MDGFRWPEMADIHLVYKAAQCNSTAAAHMYRERYPNRHVPHHSTYTAIDRWLCEQGTFMVRKHVHAVYLHDITAIIVHCETEHTCPNIVHVTGIMLAIYGLYEYLTLKRCCGGSTSCYLPACQVVHAFHTGHMNVLPTMFKVHAVVFTTMCRRATFPKTCCLGAKFTRECMLTYLNCHTWAKANTHTPIIRNYQEQFGSNL
ncbi:hypothetical protein PR048_027510 [Dryococelus australis]|uniref:DUF4817 domain-containing protein n=1 Tax=Dryococelus australis TaxID=614101 RepID=A0ABQ9GGQ8_9NEOP|nr:hypothetical protein PR048_027510 [Dryococelus australis]